MAISVATPLEKNTHTHILSMCFRAARNHARVCASRQKAAGAKAPPQAGKPADQSPSKHAHERARRQTNKQASKLALCRLVSTPVRGFASNSGGCVRSLARRSRARREGLDRVMVRGLGEGVGRVGARVPLRRTGRDTHGDSEKRDMSSLIDQHAFRHTRFS